MPIQMIAWSLVASMQAFLSGRTSFFVTRFLLGILEGGFIPDMILYLSYWYTSSELPKRLSVFWVASQSTNIISAVNISSRTYLHDSSPLIQLRA
jgi:MFS family permease